MMNPVIVNGAYRMVVFCEFVSICTVREDVDKSEFLERNQPLDIRVRVYWFRDWDSGLSMRSQTGNKK